ncbi:MAG: NUDIX domain-containing protein [Flavobacteriales bacterium]|nr:NUDIX domain-containing protein [Flavobacteriales bacterium]
MSFPFNVRVYGVLFEKGAVLLSSETYAGRRFTKFPGGGLEFGEGLKDAIVREFMEETGVEVKVVKHLYTTDFFQESAFNPAHQVISVYYQIAFSQKPEQLPSLISLEADQTFEWVELESLTAEMVTFPIDRYLIEKVLPGLGR